MPNYIYIFKLIFFKMSKIGITGFGEGGLECNPFLVYKPICFEYDFSYIVMWVLRFQDGSYFEEEMERLQFQQAYSKDKEREEIT